MPVSEQLLEILSESETISAGDLERMVDVHQERGGSFTGLLLDEELIGEDDLFFMMSRRLGVPAIPEQRLLHLTLSREIRVRVSRKTAREGSLVPLDLDMNTGTLSVAIFDPTDSEVLDHLREVSRVTEIRTYLARRSVIRAAVEAAYSPDDEDSPPGELQHLGQPNDAVDDRRGGRTMKHLDPSPGEAKVEIDPSLASVVETFSQQTPVRPSMPVEPRGADQAAERERPAERERRPAAPPRPQGRQGVAPPARPTARPAAPAVPVAPAVPALPSPGDSGRHEVVGRSLMHDTDRHSIPQAPKLKSVDVAESDGDTNPFQVMPPVLQDEDDLELAVSDDDDEPVEDALENEITQVRSAAEIVEEPTPASPPPLPSIQQMEQVDSLLRELLSSVGILVSMLEERIDPTGGVYQDYGRVSRLTARELGLDEIQISRVALSAHLYSLDMALRQEVGTATRLDAITVFSTKPTAPGGLGPSLRSLGAKALSLTEDTVEEPVGLRIIRLVAEYLELRAESNVGASDQETVLQLLRAGGKEPALVDAMVRAVEASDTPRIMTHTNLESKDR